MMRLAKFRPKRIGFGHSLISIKQKRMIVIYRDGDAFAFAEIY